MSDAEPRPSHEPIIAVYPGSFDPITVGHLDILERAVKLFDHVIVAIGQHPTKPGYFSVERRAELIRRSAEHLTNFEVSAFSGLVVDFCRERGAKAIVRGLRAVSDFEPEFQMGLANRDLDPGVETVFLIPRPDRMFVSSSLVREIAGHGGHYQRYVSPAVAQAMAERVREG
ncbi:pantetheine-phosphate adenylyltransferase [Paraliomyxa miuraensis]|uniref:pantetheine-phosphate adenylyltransferase n=1 Tax=Paraliomyxa miuraensis TaxID=376150 RepID=UPI002256979C|nr:pantetheine-phosphate adenylyltransferase [Paraliomyxa miuraensis]MCX4244909.1 pantetheine-phosphate adenylyltransferase [Paraliomyxa miuraensis]